MDQTAAKSVRMPNPGEPAPWFHAQSPSNPRFAFDTVGGRYLVLFFFGSAGYPNSARALSLFHAEGNRFNDETCCFFGVTIDPQDQQAQRVQDRLPGYRYFWDFDQAISRLYGVCTEDQGKTLYRTCTYVLDLRMRVLRVFPLSENPEGHVRAVMDFLATLPPIPGPRIAESQAPVLVVPNVFDPAFCRELIDLYERNGGEDSGFMRDVNGRTVAVLDHGFKRRRDYEITDEQIRNRAMHRIHDRMVPEIAKAFQFKATRMERYIVAGKRRILPPASG